MCLGDRRVRDRPLVGVETQGESGIVLQSTTLYNKAGSGTSLAGVYVSGNGDVAGPYTQIASPSKLANSGAAQKQTVIGKGYLPGVQAWYNRFVAVDPESSVVP